LGGIKNDCATNLRKTRKNPMTTPFEAVTVEGEVVSGASADKELGGEPKDN